MANVRGIFRLKQVYGEQLSGNWSVKSDVWLSPSAFYGPASAPVGYSNGYFSGGFQPSNSPSFPSSVAYSSVSRIDYSNDTTTIPARGPLTGGVYKSGGTGNQDFGYVGGGLPYGSRRSEVDRIDYSNDTATASPRGQLSTARYELTATGNASFGYFIGGRNPTFSTVDRIDYTNDTATASVRGPLSSAVYFSSATGNQSFGYSIGGKNTSVSPYILSKVDRIDYSNDTATASPKGPLSVERSETGTTGNSDFGYVGGGYNIAPGGNNWVSTVDRIDYSNDTVTASPKGPLSRTMGTGCATGDKSFGYFGGGEGNNNENVSTLDRIDYSNDTATALSKGPLSHSLRQSAASSSKQNANPIKNDTLFPASTVRDNIIPQGTDFGYMIGGAVSGSNKSKIERIDYSNDTANASLKGPLSGNRKDQGATSSASFGYVTGGPAVVDRIDYANDTAATAPKGPLSAAKYRLSATGNADFGYFGGGQPTNSTVERLDYSNDTATAVAKGPLSVAREQLAATGNQNFGYFGGGYPPTTSVIDRIDYSNDTATASPKGPLSSGKRQISATGNADFGYFTKGGGAPVNRVDYSNDTATALQKGSVTNGQDSGSASSTTHGYFGGGAPGPLSSVSRLDYSNDTANSVAKGPLTAATRYLCGTSSRANAMPLKGPGVLSQTFNLATGATESPNTGYYIGGYPGSISTVDRIDYSNDTATASVKGPLSAAVNYHAAVSSAAHTYRLGGGTVSTVDRIDHSNDTATASVKGPLSEAVYRSFTAMGNADFGYLAGGARPPATATTKVDRIDYSNDTATALAKGPLASARYLTAGVGNKSFGYVTGGSFPFQDNSLVQRIDYSNDTATASPKGPLDIGRRKLAGAGNADFGYLGGGSNPSTQSISRIDYSNDTATTLAKGSLNVSRETHGATSNANFGYFGGGWTSLSSVERIDYSNDTATASLKGPLSVGRSLFSAAGARDNGNFVGPSVVSNGPVQTGQQNYGGYIFGGAGDPSLSPAVNQPTQRIDFINDTFTATVRGAPAAPAGGNLYYNFAVGNRNYAYTGNAGNSAPAPIQRFDYSNETNSLVVKGAINTVLIGASGPTPSVGGYNAAATGNHDYGWINGGYKLYSVPAPSGYYTAFSQIDRIDYSNDTADTLRRSYTTNRFGTGSATGTNSYGYWIGGSTDMTAYSGRSTKVDRTDYSNDTTNAVARGDLTTVHGGESDSIGNSSYGWVAGGRPYSSTIVDRIDYSNDTATAVLKGPLTTARWGMSTTGSQSYGYFCGSSSPITTTVERIDYSNDTATASPKGPLVYKNQHSSGASTTYNALPST